MGRDNRIVAAVLVAAVVGSMVGVGAMAIVPDGGGDGPAVPDRRTPGPSVPSDPGDDPAVEQFESKAAFERYVRRSDTRRVYMSGGVGGADGGDDVATGTPMATVTVQDAPNEAARSSGGPERADEPRYSGTNVQEQGIQEPDVLKSDGETVYFSNRPARVYHHHDDERRGRIRVLDASTPARPELVGNVSARGRMFLTNDTLVVIEDERVVGYDVSDPANPIREWGNPLNGRVAAARMYDGEMYLVIQQGIRVDDPCPVEPLGGGPEIGCTDVYHPVGDASAEVTYTTMRVAPDTGEVRDTVSVVGSRRHAATYVSQDSVYLTYTRDSSYLETMTTFLLSEKRGLIGERTAERLEEVRELNVSERARQVELRVTLERWYRSLDEDRREEVTEDLQEDFRQYLEEHKRDLTTTGIVEISIDGGLSIAATGEVPGHPLNQFSMDESDGTLRIATTVSGMRTESENDLYVLDEDLDRQGSVRGMAPGQRIYSVRYVGDTAYVVTFRQVDPFHVIDLSDPDDPEELGQVKLPGFSRYLHPMGNDTVLGIGEEDGRVKATLFDVSTPSDPEVMDSKVVDDHWSAISETHHAFLLDRKHGVFFLPGSEGGYVFGYEDGLSLKHRVDTQGPARRAMYIGDYMYVFARGGLTVVDETDWSREGGIDFPEYEGPDPDPDPEPRPPEVRIEPEVEDGSLRLEHRAGMDVEGANLELRCEDTTVEIANETFETGDTIVETDACSPGQDAVLLWTSPESDVVVPIRQFRVPDED